MSYMLALYTLQAGEMSASLQVCKSASLQHQYCLFPNHLMIAQGCSHLMIAQAAASDKTTQLAGVGQMYTSS